MPHMDDPNETESVDSEREYDYDVDDRYAHIRVNVLGQEYTDVVRVCEQFPGLPDGITVYVNHVDAIDLRRERNNYCPNCGHELPSNL